VTQYEILAYVRCAKWLQQSSGIERSAAVYQMSVKGQRDRMVQPHLLVELEWSVAAESKRLQHNL